MQKRKASVPPEEVLDLSQLPEDKPSGDADYEEHKHMLSHYFESPFFLHPFVQRDRPYNPDVDLMPVHAADMPESFPRGLRPPTHLLTNRDAVRAGFCRNPPKVLDMGTRRMMLRAWWLCSRCLTRGHHAEDCTGPLPKTQAQFKANKARLALAEKYAKEGTEKEAEEKEESDIEDYLQPTKKSRRGR